MAARAKPAPRLFAAPQMAIRRVYGCRWQRVTMVVEGAAPARRSHCWVVSMLMTMAMVVARVCKPSCRRWCVSSLVVLSVGHLPGGSAL